MGLLQGGNYWRGAAGTRGAGGGARGAGREGGRGRGGGVPCGQPTQGGFTGEQGESRGGPCYWVVARVGMIAS